MGEMSDESNRAGSKVGRQERQGRFGAGVVAAALEFGNFYFVSLTNPIVK